MGVQYNCEMNNMVDWSVPNLVRCRKLLLDMSFLADKNTRTALFRIIPTLQKNHQYFVVHKNISDMINKIVKGENVCEIGSYNYGHEEAEEALNNLNLLRERGVLRVYDDKNRFISQDYLLSNMMLNNIKHRFIVFSNRSSVVQMAKWVKDDIDVIVMRANSEGMLERVRFFDIHKECDETRINACGKEEQNTQKNKEMAEVADICKDLKRQQKGWKMVSNKVAENKERINYVRKINKDYVFMMDTSFLLNEEFSKFYEVLKTVLLETGNKFIVPSVVLSELQRVASDDVMRKNVLNVLNIIKDADSNEIIEIAYNEEDPEDFADVVLIMQTLRMRTEWKKKRLAVLTYDAALSEDILSHINNLSSVKGKTARVFRIGEEGGLREYVLQN